MTLDCAHCLPYIFTFIFGLVVSKQIYVDRDSIEENYLAKNPFLPTFLTTSGNISVTKGEEAILPCAIEHRGTRTVVWRLKSHPAPLTIGVKTYISDTRFKVVHHKHSLEWNLHIMNAQPQDSGIYECQVAAVARNIRQSVQLTVKEAPRGKQASRSKSSISSSSSSAPLPEITIKGSFFVERGDTLKLQCNATGSEYHPDEIDWFKDGNKIKNSERISLEKHVSFADRTITSSLHIKRGHMNDAGTYVCRTSDLQVTSVKVNVLNTGTKNEKRESMDSSVGEKESDSSGSLILTSKDPWTVTLMLFLAMLSSYSGHVILL